MSFQLSATLVGHEQDVRSVASAGPNALVSTLRDGTVRVWKATNGGWKSSYDAIIAFNSPTKTFINSLAYVQLPGESLIANAGQDTMIYLSDLDAPIEDTGKYQLIGHEANVCSLSFGHHELISGSWDATARVWDLESFATKYTLQGHQSSVWDVKVLSEGRYLTCSADRTIRVWDGKHEIAQFTGHSDVVRKLLVFPDGKRFASASNDGTIKIWDLGTGQVLQTLSGHLSFVYDVALLPNGDLVSTGEDRTIRIWRNGVAIQVITLPCISVWCVAVLDNGDIAVGSSDNLVRVFTREEARVAPAEELLQLKEEVQASSIAEQSLDDLKKTDIPGYDALKVPGKQEGATLMVKSPEGVIEAHQWSGGEWIKIGDVVGSSHSKEKKVYDGKEYDYVFDVDVKDGVPPLKLPYNTNENPYIAAERFLAANELPSSYTDEVVRFINKNTEGFELQTAEPAPNPYADSEQKSKPAVQSTALHVIPEKTYITFKDYKTVLLTKGLTLLNQKQEVSLQFLSIEIETVSRNLDNLNSKNAMELITQFVPRIINDWKPETRLIGYDILRVSIPRITAVDILKSTEGAEVIFKAFSSPADVVDESFLPLLMLQLKTLSNLVENVLFVQVYVDPTNDGQYQYNLYFKELLNGLAKQVRQSSQVAKQSKHYNTTTTAVATLAYNLSALHLRTSNFNAYPEAAEPVTRFLADVGEVVIDSNPEAAYRLAVAYGNFKYLKVPVAAPSWLNKATSIEEERFVKLASDILNL
ncbi:PFU-domain-containing protein [Suhomyces tanzawaensis NRRL Y-17324]|uniref:PFU-domain-containing protein n=1 Tax=Suhomyces tanzawaensis NRRL Y-17324 TaxID=984487 RepID=A0A1E4SBP0_9ASCO|nr:PFU-domain-containing protein [Suhomyces tanzawaensis NRRL Y-17324]ODV76913.1 PFU-domain-containing protein [Suhomyces tanzawaensis NRRL Y-17324]